MRARRAASYKALIRTVANNYFTVGLGFASSILLARGLEPTGRGEYAVLASLLALAVVVAELGQSGAVTYWAARHPERVRAFVRSARRIMLVGAVVTLGASVVGLVVVHAPWRWTLGVAMLASLLMNAYFAPSQYALLAISNRRWNVARMVGPSVLLFANVLLFMTNSMTVSTAITALVLSTSTSLVSAAVLLRAVTVRPHAAPTAIRWKERAGARSMKRFGAIEFMAGVPYMVAQHGDKVVLAYLTDPSALGQYVVALSIVALSPPLANGVSTALAPSIAKGQMEAQGAHRIVLLTAGISAALVTVVCFAGWVAIPLVFGNAFAPAAALSVLMIPAGIGKSANLACTGLLRGTGNPHRIAFAYGVTVCATFGGFALLVPSYSMVGACVALGIGELLGAFVAIASVLKVLRSESLPTDGGA